jgi:hypothetical protein
MTAMLADIAHEQWGKPRLWSVSACPVCPESPADGATLLVITKDFPLIRGKSFVE